MPIIMLMMVIMSNCQPWSDNYSLTVPIAVKSRQEVFHRGLLALSQFVTPEETMKRMRILMTRLYNPTFGRIWSKLNCQAQVAKIDKASLYRNTASFPPCRELSFKHGSWFHAVVKLVMNWRWRRGAIKKEDGEVGGGHGGVPGHSQGDIEVCNWFLQGSQCTSQT